MKDETLNTLRSLKQGEKYTMFFFNEFGFPCTVPIRFYDYAIGSYAQYKESIVLRFVQKKKRTRVGKRIYGSQRIFLFNGWIDINDEMMVEKDGDIERSRMCFDEQYIIDGLNSVDQKPMILTTK